MLTDLYRRLLRMPHFPGKGRIERAIRGRWLGSRPSTISHGLLMILDPIEWTQADLLRDGRIEPLTTNLYGMLLRSGDAYIDVGAHVGFHTLVARRWVGPDGRVVAIEPQPYNCAKLMTNWEANGFDNVILYVAAAGDVQGDVVLNQQRPCDGSRLSLCLAPTNNLPQKFRVPIRRLDTICRELGLGQVRLLKIDVEGYELEVLRGATAVLGAVEHVIVESLQQPETVSRDVAVARLLEAHGYRLRTVLGRPWSLGEALPERNLWASRGVD